LAYLLDTDTCSWLIHRRPGHEGIIERCDGKRYGEILISAISFAELQFMAANSADASAKRSQIAHFLLSFPVIPFDDGAAMTYGDIRLALRGSPIGAVENWIRRPAA
jgi:tRNA(fMet)-specific endonuclease VapC